MSSDLEASERDTSKIDPGSADRIARHIAMRWRNGRSPSRHGPGRPAASSVPNQKFGGLQIDSMIADPSDPGEDWLWVDALDRWSLMRGSAVS
jgi:hypothetical protein